DGVPVPPDRQVGQAGQGTLDRVGQHLLVTAHRRDIDQGGRQRARIARKIKVHVGSLGDAGREITDEHDAFRTGGPCSTWIPRSAACGRWCCTAPTSSSSASPPTTRPTCSSTTCSG